MSFVPVGPVTADRYSRIMTSLRARGRPIPDKRRLDRSTRDGDRRGPGLSGQSLRARRPGRLGERDVGLRAARSHRGDDSMESMRNRVRSRRLRGLVLHHRRHPSTHPRRLVTRTASWGQPSVRGVCRWCHRHTAAIHLTWHDYCLAAYRVASGQKPPGIQVTMCEGCGGPAAELDHRLANQRRPGDGTRGAQESVHAGEPAVALQLLHRRKTRLDRRLAQFLSACSLDWRGARRAWRVNRAWADVFLAPLGMVDAGRHAEPLEDVRTAA